MRVEFGGDAEVEKLRLLERVANVRFAAKSDLLMLHESLLFIAAYPDSARTKSAAEAALTAFAERIAGARPSVRESLAESGLAGTEIRCALALPVVRALLERHAALSVFEEGEGVPDKLELLLREILTLAEAEAFVDGYLSAED